jgi:hypothetical protein
MVTLTELEEQALLLPDDQRAVLSARKWLLREPGRVGASRGAGSSVRGCPITPSPKG